MSKLTMEEAGRLREEIEALARRAAWCWRQVDGLQRQIDGCGRNDEYWDTRDLISQRRLEAASLESQIAELKKQIHGS